MSFSLKRLGFFRVTKSRAVKTLEDASQMWCSKFPELSELLTVLGYAYTEEKNRIFNLIVKRMDELNGQNMMHGLKSTMILMFLVSLKQPQALQIAENFKNSLVRNSQTVKVVNKERHISKYYLVVVKHLVRMISDPVYHDSVEYLVKKDIVRCYEGLDLVSSAQKGNVFFPRCRIRPKCSYWVLEPSPKIMNKMMEISKENQLKSDSATVSVSKNDQAIDEDNESEEFIIEFD
ncbi:MAG: hypothetical protein MHPSP_000797 [Paramarteilia canceri]